MSLVMGEALEAIAGSGPVLHKRVTFTGTGNNGAVSASASAAIVMDGDDNDLVATAAAAGILGNSSSIEFTADGPDQALAVSVEGRKITVQLETDAGTASSGTITSNESALASGDTVTIGTATYRFMTVPVQDRDVFLAGGVNASMARLVLAINGP